MSEFVTAKDLVRRGAYPSVRAMVHAMSQTRGLPWTGKVSGAALYARVDFMRWLVDCPHCGGAEYIDPEEPFFFCVSCGNAENRGDAYPVIVPSKRDRDAIERALLERPVRVRVGSGDRIEQAVRSVPEVRGLGRSWNPGERVRELKDQNKLINLAHGKKE
jgi:hypothetical protein